MPSLTRDEAVTRAAVLRVDAYDLDLDLRCGDRVFRSTSTIRFTSTQSGVPTFFEVKPDRLNSVTLDGWPLDTAALDDGRFPLAQLHDGVHELVVIADMAYTNDGQGMHRFVDPADGETYVYAAMFLDSASSVYACFEQPDLKAPYTARVTADPACSVVANGAGTQVEPGRWEFATTMPLATYFVAFAAGPFHRVESEHDGIPLALYARASLATHLDAQAPEIFAVTAASFDRYHEMFGVRYPFGKYDQAFMPEFTLGAMENPGCVTLRDEYIFTSAVTDAEREHRAVVIAHEMAHMWFGDLVTMRWWDDLWLNESFAEYLGYRVVAEVTEFTDAWTEFSIGRKAWGYAADQRPSTHPVAPENVEDTIEALANFDGISYAKGAAVLRQLVAWLGDEAFLAGLRAHFGAHAFGNATLADLLAALGEAAGRDLSEWARVWLRTAQVSTLRPDIVLDGDGRYASVAVLQSAPVVPPATEPVLRPHRINVATGELGDDGRVRPRDVVEVDVEGARSDVPGLAGKPAAAVLLINDGDLTYAKIRLDDAALAGLSSTLPVVGDSLTRALLWGALWDATRDAETPATVFLDVCVAALPAERNVATFADVVEYALDRAVDAYLPVDARDAARARLRDACATALTWADPGSGRQLAAARAWIRCAGAGDVAGLRSWLASPDAAPAGLAVDADLRWALTGQLAALGALSDEDIDAEYARDHTAIGAERSARARASRPDPAAKAAAWARLIGDDTLSNRLLFATARGFWRADQAAVTEPYIERYVIDMPAMAQRRTPQVVDRLAVLAYPAYAVDPATLVTLSEMAASADLAPGLRRSVIDQNDELARSLAARSLAVTALAAAG